MAQVEWKINRNMGCIEIAIKAGTFKRCLRLIETWDVLKFLEIVQNCCIP